MDTKLNFKHALMVAFAVMLIIGGQFYIAIPSCAPRANLCFNTSGGLLAPYRYRLLSQALQPNVSEHPSVGAIITAALLVHSVCALLTCVGLFIWLKRVSTPERAIMGLFILVCDWLLAFWFYQTDTAIALELTFITWALVLIDGALLPLIALTALATLNRETGVFIPLIYAAWHFDRWRERRYLVNVGLLLLTFAAVFLSVHWVMGSAEHTLGLNGTLTYNLDFENLRNGILINLILLPLWAMVVYACRTAPHSLRRLLIVAVLMLGAIVVGAAWGEMARLALVAFPLVLPVVIRS